MSRTLTIKNLQLRNDTSANWKDKNTVLAKGEMAIEIDTDKFKFGDGVTAWNDLDYVIVVDSELNTESLNPVQNKVVNEAVHYTNETPIVSAIGGIKVGATFDAVPVTEMLTKILYPYIKPLASISVTPNGVVAEKGTSVNVTALKVTATRKSSDIASVVAKQGNTVITTLTDGVAKGGTFDCLPSGGITLTANTTFTGVVTDVDGGSASATSSSFTFVDPYYYGVVAEGTTMTSDVIKGLTKKVEVKGNKTFKYTTNGECMVLAYPKSYGALKSAVDPNGFENIASYTQQEVTVACESGNVAYYVYVKTPSTVSDFAIAYKY